jgi:hypothetical protein
LEAARLRERPRVTQAPSFAAREPLVGLIDLFGHLAQPMDLRDRLPRLCGFEQKPLTPHTVDRFGESEPVLSESARLSANTVLYSYQRRVGRNVS